MVKKIGVIQDFVDGLENWVKGLFKDGITAQFTNIGDLMNDSFNSSSSSGLSGMINTFLRTHPANFTGSSSGGTSIWTTVETICNNVVVPIAGMVMVIFLLTDLIQMVTRGNNFKDFDDSIFFKWIVKALCGVILISNVYYIASGLFSFGVGATSGAINTLFNGTTLSNVTLNRAALDNMSIGQLISTWFISLIVYLGVMIMIVAIIIVLASRIIEIFMYLGISPIPVATLVEGGEFGSIGKNWIKQLVALSFQGFFIVIAIAIFKTLFNNTISTINSADPNENIILQMAILLGYTCALIFTVLRTGAISKSAFNAH